MVALKDLGLTVDSHMDVNQHLSFCSLPAKAIQVVLAEALHPRGTAVRPHLQRSVRSWMLHFRKDADKLERTRDRVARMMYGVEGKLYGRGCSGGIT